MKKNSGERDQERYSEWSVNMEQVGYACFLPNFALENEKIAENIRPEIFLKHYEINYLLYICASNFVFRLDTDITSFQQNFNHITTTVHPLVFLNFSNKDLGLSRGPTAEPCQDFLCDKSVNLLINTRVTETPASFFKS